MERGLRGRFEWNGCSLVALVLCSVVMRLALLPLKDHNPHHQYHYQQQQRRHRAHHRRPPLLGSGNVIAGTDIPIDANRPLHTPEELRTAIRNSVREGRTAFTHGNMRLALERYSGARQMIPPRKFANENDSKFYSQVTDIMACCYSNLGEYRSAMAMWEDALQRNPLHVGAHYNLAVLLSNTSLLQDPIYRTIPDLSAAKWHCKKAMQLQKSSQESSDRPGYFRSLYDTHRLLLEIESDEKAGYQTVLKTKVITVSSRPFGLKVGDNRRVLSASGHAAAQGVEVGDEVVKIDGQRVDFERFLELFRTLKLPFDLHIMPRGISEKLYYKRRPTRYSLKYAAARHLDCDPIVACENYTVQHQKAMMSDVPRVSSFAQAVNKSAVGRKLVLEIGCGPSAYFSRLAAQAGASHVVAVEANNQSFHLAKEVVKRTNLTNKITILYGYSTKITEQLERTLMEKLLDDAGDERSGEDVVLIHDCFGEVASSDGCVRVFNHAHEVIDRVKQRLGRRRGGDASSSAIGNIRTTLPSRVLSYIFPTEAPPITFVDKARVTDDDYWRQSELDEKQRIVKILGYPSNYSLSAPDGEVLEEFALASPPLPTASSKELEFIVSRDGDFEGFATYIAVHHGDGKGRSPPSLPQINLADGLSSMSLVAGETRTNAAVPAITSLLSKTPRRISKGEMPSWWNLFLRFPRTSVRVGDTISVQFHGSYAAEQPRYNITACIRRPKGNGGQADDELIMAPSSISW